jgi:hypothetical protein
MTIGEELLFETFTLLETPLPTGTVPKLTVPGETKRPLPPSGTLTPAPQPDVTTVKQQAKANMRAFPNPLNRRIVVPGWTRNPFRLENPAPKVSADAITTWQENGKMP